MYCPTQGLTCDKLVFYLVRRFNYSYLLCNVETVARPRLYGPGWLRKGLNYIRTHLVKGIVCHICLFFASFYTTSIWRQTSKRFNVLLLSSKQCRRTTFTLAVLLGCKKLSNCIQQIRTSNMQVNKYKQI